MKGFPLISKRLELRHGAAQGSQAKEGQWQGKYPVVGPEAGGKDPLELLNKGGAAATKSKMPTRLTENKILERT